MVLSDPDFDNDDAYNTPGAYPPHPPVPTFLGFQTGMFSDEGKQRFINLQLNLARQEFSFYPTPVEKEGLSYYHALFYAAEAKGALYGTLGGGAIAFLMTRRQRNVGFLFRGIGNRLRIQPKFQLLASRLTNFAFITAIGRLWGITSYGVTAFNTVGKQQKEDPNMQRYLQTRNLWLNQRQRSARAGIPPKRIVTSVEEARELAERYEGDEGQRQAEMEDSQSLGGLQVNETLRVPQEMKEVEDTGVARRASIEAGTKARAAMEGVRRDDGGDPFFGDDDSEQQQRQPQQVTEWRNRQSQPRGGSSWDRLRKGDAPNSSQSPWLKQTEESQEPFSFSGDEERERAQREFDEKVQRERRGEGADGFVSEPGQSRRR